MALVTLVKPPTAVSRWAHTTPTCPPLGVAYLAGSLAEAGHRVAVVDAVGEDPFQMLPVPGNDAMLSHGLSVEEVVERVPGGSDVIGVSCMFSHEWPESRRLLRALREAFPEARLIAGGEHVTALPEESLRSAPGLDACVLGEGEETLVELVAALRDGAPLLEVPGIAFLDGDTFFRTPARQRIRDIDAIPPPRWEGIPLENYLDNGFGFGVHRGRSMPLMATRGCPYRCTFCSNEQMWTTRWLARKPDAVIAEMREARARFDVVNYDFYDLTAIVRKDWILDFTRLLEEEPLGPITWQLPSGTRSEALDDEAAQAMYRSGCRNLSYAPESGSMAVLTRIKKRIDLGEMIRSMRATLAAGMNVKANIILGFPHETHAEVRETMAFIVRMAWAGVHDVSISPFSPYPGSELFDDLRREGRLPADLDDQYFWDLASYTDITSSISWSEHISDRALGRYRILGMAMFYVLGYLFRPWRVLRTLRNLWTREHESRLEMSLHDLLVRLGQR